MIGEPHDGRRSERGGARMWTSTGRVMRFFGETIA